MFARAWLMLFPGSRPRLGRHVPYRLTRAGGVLEPASHRSKASPVISTASSPGRTGTAIGRRFAEEFAENSDDGATESTRYRHLAFGLFGVYMLVAVGIYL